MKTTLHWPNHFLCDYRKRAVIFQEHCLEGTREAKCCFHLFPWLSHGVVLLASRQHQQHSITSLARTPASYTHGSIIEPFLQVPCTTSVLIIDQTQNFHSSSPARKPGDFLHGSTVPPYGHPTYWSSLFGSVSWQLCTQGALRYFSAIYLLFAGSSPQHWTRASHWSSSACHISCKVSWRCLGIMVHLYTFVENASVKSWTPN